MSITELYGVMPLRTAHNNMAMLHRIMESVRGKIRKRSVPVARLFSGVIKRANSAGGGGGVGSCSESPCLMNNNNVREKIMRPATAVPGYDLRVLMQIYLLGH